ncbi:MAG TPA: acetyl-CoA carboxylase biotin carboxyl carrier protein [Paracoccaceae bacterium]|nr:acetyl-CoA carboxylase biotin carboxyl carrier protein [Paracoccaceae bacterium]
MSEKNQGSDVAFIQALAEMLNTNELTEIEVMREYGKDDVLNVRVSRQTNVVAAAPVHHVAHAPAAPVAAAAHTAAPAPVATDDPANHPGAVASPMVGTVYLAPEPGAANFVSVGDKIAEGQTILIIEAMKTMNQIPSPKAGTIKRILVEDGSPVEFGSPLVIIE